MLRAAVEFCGGPAVDDFAQEQAAAAALCEAVDAGSSPARPGPDAVAVQLGALRALGPEISALNKAAVEQGHSSPSRRREDWIRRAAVVAIIGLTFWLYSRSEAPKPPPSRPRRPAAGVQDGLRPRLTSGANVRWTAGPSANMRTP